MTDLNIFKSAFVVALSKRCAIYFRNMFKL